MSIHAVCFNFTPKQSTNLVFLDSRDHIIFPHPHPPPPHFFLFFFSQGKGNHKQRDTQNKKYMKIWKTPCSKQGIDFVCFNFNQTKH